MHVIGEETAERLDVIPAQFRVIVTHRPKYACRACEEAVVQAPAPERLIKGGLPTEAMVASVLVAKYAWHLPLYRQAQMLARPGPRHQALDPGVLGRLCGGRAQADLCCGCASSSWPRARSRSTRRWRRCSIPAAAAPRRDTSGRSRATTGRGAGPIRRPSPTATRPVAARSTRSKLLDGYRGIVQCDGYAAYKTIADKAPGEAITLAFCWAHLRRHFFDIAKGGDAPIASEALERIAALYAIEKTIRGRSADERRAVRQEQEQAARRRAQGVVRTPAHPRLAPRLRSPTRSATA